MKTSVAKIETDREGVDYVINHTSVPAVAAGTALIVPYCHAAACRYLSRGVMVEATKDDVERYEKEGPH
jgi:hypothetical protein